MEITRMSYSARPENRQHKTKSLFKKIILYLFILILVGSPIIYAYLALTKPLPKLNPTITLSSVKDSVQPTMQWPSQGQAAVGSLEDGILASSSEQTAVPIASTAKVITALAILKKKPFSSGQGETITLTQKDVDIYNYYVSVNGSNTPVVNGEEISEYQALEALMLPSANNMADSLAIWAFGTIDSYVTYANNLIRGFGATNTKVADPSGFSPNTVSTANDLILIGQQALNHPILKQIVAEKEANIPAAGQIHNVNQLLGTKDIIGIKTGNTEEAGGCLLFAANHKIDGKYPITIIGAVVGQSNLGSAFQSTLSLLESVVQNFQQKTVLKAGTEIGYYSSKWGTKTLIYSKKDIIITGWKDLLYSMNTVLSDFNTPINSGTTVGTISISASGQTATSSLVIKNSISSPSIIWRLLHYF